jgi:hypothetical protein
MVSNEPCGENAIHDAFGLGNSCITSFFWVSKIFTLKNQVTYIVTYKTVIWLKGIDLSLMKYFYKIYQQ